MSEQMSSSELLKVRRRMLRNLLRDDDAYDLSLLVPIPDGSKLLIRAHSLIMANFSPLIRSYKQMLRCNCSNVNCGSNINELSVVIADSKEDTVHLMLKLAYCGQVTVDLEQKGALIKLLNQFGVKGIIDDDDNDVCKKSSENYQRNDNCPQNGDNNDCSESDGQQIRRNEDQEKSKDMSSKFVSGERTYNNSEKFGNNKSIEGCEKSAISPNNSPSPIPSSSKNDNEGQSSPRGSLRTRSPTEGSERSTSNGSGPNNSPDNENMDDNEEDDDDDDEVYDIDDDEYSSDSETDGSDDSDAAEEVREKYRTRKRAEDEEDGEDGAEDEEENGEEIAKSSRKRKRVIDEEDNVEKCGKRRGGEDEDQSGNGEEEEDGEIYEEESNESDSDSEEENESTSESKHDNELSLKTPVEIKQCVRCEEEFNSNPALAFHLTTHLKDSMSKKLFATTGQTMAEMRSCFICKKEFLESNGVPNRLRHLLLMHHFGQEFLRQSEKELLKSLNTAKKYCKKKQLMKKATRREEIGEKEKSFQCERCHKQLGTYSGICYHIITHHRDIIRKRVEREAGTKVELMNGCFKCKKKFSKPPFLPHRLQHFAKKHSFGLDKMNCEERKFFQGSAKTDPPKRHFCKPVTKLAKKALQKEFNCNRCSRIFKDRKGLCFHLIAHAGPKLLKLLEEETGDKNANKCHICNHVFSGSDSAKLRHVVLEHGLGLELMTASERSVFRMQARLKEIRLQNYKKTQKKSAKNQNPTIKVKKGETNNMIEDDIKTNNEEPRAMQCGRCDRSFDMRGSLVMHIIAHLKDKLIKLIESEKGMSPYEMDECFVCQAPMKIVGTAVAVQGFLRHLVCHHDFGLSLLTRSERNLLSSIEKSTTKMVAKPLPVSEGKKGMSSMLDELDKEEIDKMIEEAANNQLSASIVRLPESKLRAMNASSVSEEIDKAPCIDHFQLCFDEDDSEVTASGKMANLNEAPDENSI